MIKRERRKVKGTTVALLLIGIIIITIMITAKVYSLAHGVIRTETLGMDLIVAKGSTIGVNVDTDAIHFGKVQPGAGSTKHLNLTNTFDFPVSVLMRPSGDISWFIPGDIYVIMQPHTQIQYTLGLSVPMGTVPRTYTGEYHITYRRA